MGSTCLNGWCGTTTWNTCSKNRRGKKGREGKGEEVRRLLFLEESIRLVGSKQWGMRGYERAHASTRGFQARFSGGPLENKTMSTIDYKITLLQPNPPLRPTSSHFHSRLQTHTVKRFRRSGTHIRFSLSRKCELLK